MKRPLFWFSVSFAAGVAICALTGSGFLILVSVLALMLKPCDKRIYMIICAALVACGAFRFAATTAEYDTFAGKYDGNFCTVIGKVYKVNKSGTETKSVSVRAKYIIRGKEISRENVRLLVYTKDKNVLRGCFVTARGIVRIPVSSDNTFDYDRYLKSENISAVMYNGETYLNITKKRSPIYNFLSFTEKDNFERFLPKENAAFMRALVLGDRRGFDDKLKNDFSASGVYHVVAVSGMHIGILIMFITQMLKFGMKKGGIRSGAAIAGILAYLAAIGAAPSALRAGITGILVMLSRIALRSDDFYTSLALSATMLIAFNPYIIYNVGFLLSYAAVVGICAFSEGIGRFTAFLPRLFGSIVAMSLSAEAATLPIRINYFHTAGIYGIASNILIIPFIEILYVLGLVSALLPPMFYVTAPLMNIMASCVLMSVHGIASLPLSSAAVGSPSLKMTVILIAALVGLHFLLKCKKRTVAAVLCAVFALSFIIPHTDNMANVNFLSVGQGDSILVKDADGRYYLTDTGKDNGAALNNMRAEGVRRLEILFISHIDDDHSGAATKIMDSMKVKTLVMPYVSEYNADVEKLCDTAVSNGTDVKYAHKGEKFEIDGGNFKVLSPGRKKLAANNTNENCLVMKLQLHGKKFLLMGDAGFLCESTLENIECDVLKIGHHGSRNSTSEKLLDKANPKYAVLSYGINDYGHPSDRVVSELDKRKIKTYHTYKNGNIKFEIDKKGGALKIGCK